MDGEFGWVSALSMALTIAAIVLFAYRVSWAWLLPVAATAVLLATGIPYGRLNTSTVFVLAAALYGLWKWTRYRREGVHVPLRSAHGREWGIGAGLLLLLFLLNGFAGVTPVAEIGPLYLFNALLAALPAVMYLGFAHGILQSWWLGVALSLSTMFLSAIQDAPVWVSLYGAIAAGLQIFGYLGWQAALRRPVRSKHRLAPVRPGRPAAPGPGAAGRVA